MSAAHAAESDRERASGCAADTVLCVMAKQPLVGQVKTRLAQTIGAAAAATLARAFLDDTLGLARSAHAVHALAYAGDPAAVPSAAAGFLVWPQGEGDLGARMERALRSGLALAAHALVIGTDSPGMPASRIEAAIAALQTHDAVLGPADDGGYYLLGLNHCPEGILAQLPWSAADTAQHTLERLRSRGFRVALLEPWFDVDEHRDLERLCIALRDGTVHAPATARALASLTLGQPRAAAGT